MIKSDIKKGDIYYASLNPTIGSEQKGERPVVVLQNDCGNKYSPTVIVAPLTKIIKKEKLPTHILIHSNDFLRYNSLILLYQISDEKSLALLKYIYKKSTRVYYICRLKQKNNSSAIYIIHIL